MIVFWKPPAGMIFGVSFFAGLLFGYFILHSAFGMDEVLANVIGVTLGCIAMVIWDIKYRKDNGCGLGDVAVSSFFGLIPTWLAGVLFCIFIWVSAFRLIVYLLSY